MSQEPVETAIILAAGMSQRFGAENKLLAEWRGRPLATHAIEAAANSALRHIILVTGQDGGAVAALAAAAPKIKHAHNADFRNGLSSSLKVGLAAAPEGPVMVLLADMPLVSSALIDELLGAWRADAYALIPQHNGQTGNPVILSAAARADAATLTGDRGARRLFDGRTGVIHYPVADAAILYDLDAKADFSR